MCVWREARSATSPLVEDLPFQPNDVVVQEIVTDPRRRQTDADYRPTNPDLVGRKQPSLGQVEDRQRDHVDISGFRRDVDDDLDLSYFLM